MPRFSDTRNILNHRPKIQFVEPEQVPGEQALLPTQEQPSPVLEKKVRVEKVIQQYKRLADLSDLALKRVDNRAKGTKVCLDPDRDAAVIAAQRRRFGDVVPCITYEQYKVCLQKIAEATQAAAIKVTPEDIEKAASDPFRTDFGGYTTTHGALAPEHQFGSPIKPVNEEKFQKDSLLKLFKMLLPMLEEFTDAKVLEHLLSAKHGS